MKTKLDKEFKKEVEMRIDPIKIQSILRDYAKIISSDMGNGVSVQDIYILILQKMKKEIFFYINIPQSHLPLK